MFEWVLNTPPEKGKMSRKGSVNYVKFICKSGRVFIVETLA